ncbi:MAG: formylglycine-generating enzyme family protein, partial [Candidatus Obscuribacterales bacterium]|nr:formylglycine-generating enzyme family protein [Candidatus Obscuribacterales bacterium]
MQNALLWLCLLALVSPGHAETKSEASKHSVTAIKEKNGMVWIPGGTFSMGSDDPSFVDAKPVHQVNVDGFWMDKCEVSNEEFSRFVKATNYKTVSERKPDAKDFPGAPPENLVPGSLVFTPPSHPVPKRSHYVWWRYVPGASWKHPDGPQSNIDGLSKYPVVQIAYEDACAYA